MKTQTLAAAVSAAVLILGVPTAIAGVMPTIGGAGLAGQGQTSAFSGQAGFTTIDFESTAIDSLPASYSGNGRVVTGSVGGVYAAPQTPTDPNRSRYLTVPNNSSSMQAVMVQAPGLSSYFGLWWGSIDNYNSIAFFNGEVQVGDTFTGAFLRTLHDPALTAGTRSQAAYFNFEFDDGDRFDRIVLTSTGFALESDNHVFGTAVVPVPGAAALMLSGLLGLLFAVRRQRKGLQIA